MRDPHGRVGHAMAGLSRLVSQSRVIFITSMTKPFHGPMLFGAITCSLLGLVVWSQVSITVEEPPTVNSNDVFVFQGVTGPTEKTVVAPPGVSSHHAYAVGGPSRLAVLLTEERSNWLGLAHGLKSIGVPFVVTRDYREALKHRVILVYPTMTGTSFPPEAFRALGAVPRNGGTLIATQVLGGGLEEVFGYSETVMASRNQEIRWNRAHPLLERMTDPAEWVTKLNGKPENLIGTYSYGQARGMLGTYPDGSVAVTAKDYDKGHAYAIGIDLGALLLKGYNNRSEGFTTSFDNRFDPTLDVWLRLLKGMYQAGEPNAVTIGTVPFGKSLSVMFTHDVDFTQSMANAVDYAEFERSKGLTGTYFIQAKYIRDYNDDIFFDEQGARYLARLSDLGMELASHTVAHSASFNGFPMGTGEEQYPGYRPFVKTRSKAYGATILGELRVSKFLIDRLGGGPAMVSFRPGELSNPFGLPQALVATGFRYSSTATANNSLTHLPYQMTYDRLSEEEVDVFEFPVTIEDEELPPMGERLPQALTLAKQVARYGGTVVVLIHPNILGHKLEFEKQFYEAVKDRAWFGSIREFGDWWSARNALHVDVSADVHRTTVSINAPRRISGMTLEVPTGWTLLPQKGVMQDGRTIILDVVEQTRVLHFAVAGAHRNS
ncbi:MAG: hypothetical protein A4C66_12165 [Nitrospira sp. HN-bin3]|uniref:hypothetical protein n=1 Tax=Nitrospira cf. moscoviensis SBR1015 TaxID=96242 RepID=UPI000A0D0BDD|nr:hypothetical protein [Nitrospira cf. moscoviensis SBR1015]OQW38271.1 MAG: hypothetical protein A4C66_12165 [Nitrospira sp. HN-bin3]